MRANAMRLSNWWQRESTIEGSLLFPGPLPVTAESFNFLSEHGFLLHHQKKSDGLHWSIRLEHEGFGAVDMVCPRGMENLQHLLDGAFMTDEGREAVKTAGSLIHVRCQGRTGNLLRDRKQVLRLCDILLGTYGLAAVDGMAFKVWSRPQLEDELSHDAALDVADIFGVHVVYNDSAVYWLHSHGMGEIGSLDFDIVSPSEDLLSPNGLDTLRAIAHAILEGELRLDEGSFLLFLRPTVEVSLIDINTFVRDSKHAAAATLREDIKNGHNRLRGVICEPRKRFLFFGIGDRPTPCKFLSGAISDGVMIHISKRGTELHSARAIATYFKFCQVLEEFAELNLPALVKIGYPTDSDPSSHEHLWFEVQRAFPDSVEATLLNRPHDIRKLTMGERSRYPVDNLSDWMILSPFGQIGPATLGVARILRSRFDEARSLIDTARQDDHSGGQ